MNYFILIALVISLPATASEKVLVTCVEPTLNTVVTVTQDPSGMASFKVTHKGTEFRSLTSKSIVITPRVLDRSGKEIYLIRRQKIINLAVQLPLQPISGMSAQAALAHLEVSAMDGSHLAEDMSCLVF